VGGGVGVEFGGRSEARTHGELMQVGADDFEVVHVGDGVGGEGFFPGGEIGFDAVGESFLDEMDGLIERDVLRGEQEVHVVGHDDVGVEFVVAEGAVVQQRLDEERGDAGDLEDGAPAVGGGGYVGYAGAGKS
jgi:hypothetical protein